MSATKTSLTDLEEWYRELAEEYKHIDVVQEEGMIPSSWARALVQ